MFLVLQNCWRHSSQKLWLHDRRTGALKISQQIGQDISSENESIFTIWELQQLNFTFTFWMVSKMTTKITQTQMLLSSGLVFQTTFEFRFLSPDVCDFHVQILRVYYWGGRVCFGHLGVSEITRSVCVHCVSYQTLVRRQRRVPGPKIVAVGRHKYVTVHFLKMHSDTFVHVYSYLGLHV